MSDKTNRLETIFSAVLELSSAEERAHYLAEVCGPDKALRQKVDKLLRAHEKAGSFLSAEPPKNQGAFDPGGLDPHLSEKPGDRIGHYRLLELIGEGGFCAVYRAEQEVPVRRQVALKIIKLGMDTRQVVARFEAERQALAVMDHPGIAKMFDAGTTDTGRPFFVMELVPGIPITRYCDEHRLTLRERLELFIPVCFAVLHAHQKGLIHRDLKPANVLITSPDGVAMPKVIDFGIAKALREQLTHKDFSTWFGQFIGTPAYMSPEQALMKGDIDTCTDIYSLGALLYELLVGQPPFDNEALVEAGYDEMLRTIRLKEVPKPSVRLSALTREQQMATAAARQSTPEALRRSLRGDLDWMLMRALEKDRARRYQSVSALADDIHRHLTHQPVSVAAPSVRYRFQKCARRHRPALAMAGLVAAALVAGTVVSAWQVRRAERHAQQAEAAKRQAEITLADMFVSRGLAAAERQEHSLAMLWFANAARNCLHDPDRAQVNALRVDAWARHSILPVRAFQAGAGLKCLQFSPDGKGLLALTGGNRCFVWDWKAEKALPWVQAGELVGAAAWSPDGFWLALGWSSGRVEIRRVPEGEVVSALAHPGPVTALAFSGNGQYLAVAGDVVRVWDCRRRAFGSFSWAHPEPVYGLLFAPGSQRLVTACRDGTARVFSFAGDQRAPRLVLGPVAHRSWAECPMKTKFIGAQAGAAKDISPAFLENGNLLLTRTAPDEIGIWEVATGRLVRRISKLCPTSPIVTSRDGKLFAGAVEGSGAGVWGASGDSAVASLFRHSDCASDMAFSPDAMSLLTGSTDHTAKLWSLPDGRARAAPIAHFTDVLNVAFSPDGQFVATGQDDGLIRLWRLPRPEAGERRLACDPGLKTVSLDPGGQFVVAAGTPSLGAGLSRARVYEVASGKLQAPALQLKGALQDAALSNRGRLLATVRAADPEEPGASAGWLEFWDLAGGQPVAAPVPLPSRPSSVTWHSGGKQVAVICRAGEVLLAELGGTNRLTWLHRQTSPPQNMVPEVRFTPDGLSLVGLGPSLEVEVWDLASAKLRYAPLRNGGSPCSAFALSRDGRLLATAAADNSVWVWTLATGQAAAKPLSHPGPVSALRFSPEGRRLLTACHDRLARLWDWQTGQLVCHPFRHADEINDLAFTPDGRWALTACRDGTAGVWYCKWGRLVLPRFSIGGPAFHLEVTTDGRYAVLGGADPDLRVLDLGPLCQTNRLSPNELCLLGEIASGFEVARGDLYPLTTAEWWARYRQFRQAQPVYFDAAANAPPLPRQAEPAIGQ